METALKSLIQVQAEVMRFLQEEAGFAQLTTVNARGFPVARTMGVTINDDWSVSLVQRNIHRRLRQLRRNPRLEIVWVGTPAPDSTNNQPHVYDFGLLIPRAVFLRGTAEFMDPDWTIEQFRRQTALNRARGFTLAPLRTDQDIVENLAGIRV